MPHPSPFPDSHEMHGDPAAGVDLGLGLYERGGLTTGTGERQSQQASGEEEPVPGRDAGRQRAQHHAVLRPGGETDGTGRIRGVRVEGDTAPTSDRVAKLTAGVELGGGSGTGTTTSSDMAVKLTTGAGERVHFHSNIAS